MLVNKMKQYQCLPENNLLFIYCSRWILPSSEIPEIIIMTNIINYILTKFLNGITFKI